MTSSTQTKLLAGVTVTVLLALVVSLTQDFQIQAEKEPYTTKSANDITIHTVFTFRDAVEESNSFEVFTQKSGFDFRNNDPVFELEGVVDSSRFYLYEAADMAHLRGTQEVRTPYAQFEVDVYLQKDGINMRHFAYKDCFVSDYQVETLFDKEEAWMGKGFSTNDIFEFKCAGYMPNNPLYEMMEEAAKQKSIQTDDDLPAGDKFPALP